MDVIKAIKKVDSQALSAVDRDEVVASCRAFILRAEASEAFKDALNAEQPDFQRFSRTSLTRLTFLLNAVANDSQVRINSLQDVEPIELIVLGLCVSTKKITRMSAELWAEHLHQARDIAKRLRSLALTNDGIADSVRQSTNGEFQQSFNRELQIGIPTSMEIIMMNDQCYHYLISHAFRFPQLVDLATNGAVSAYLPRITGADCFLRLVTTFNLGLIKNLFDFSMDSYSVEGFPLNAPKNLIMPVLGEDVFRAIQACSTWAGEHGLTTTNCVKGMVYPGHVIVIDILIEFNAGVAFVNSAS